MISEKIQSFLDEKGIAYKENGNSFILDCPKCGKSKKLWILKKNGNFVCWYCKELDGFGGRAEWALSEILHTTISDVRRQLYGDAPPTGIELSFDLKEYGVDLVDVERVILPVIDWPPDSVTLIDKAATRGVAYLNSRGLDIDHMHNIGVTYWPSKRRVLFPVKNAKGELVGYQGRSIDPGVEPKILTSTGLRREHALMFEDQIEVPENQKKKQIILCEGPVDALKIGRFAPGAVATMGKAVSEQQLEIIRRHNPEVVYLALDPDAIEESILLLSRLGDIKEIRLVSLPYGKKDLGECTYKEAYGTYQKAEVVSSGNLLFALRVPTNFA